MAEETQNDQESRDVAPHVEETPSGPAADLVAEGPAAPEADERDAEIARLREEVVARDVKIVALHHKRRRALEKLVEAIEERKRTQRDIDALFLSAESDAEKVERESEDFESLFALEAQESAERLHQEERRRHDVEARLAEAEQRAATERAALQVAHEETLIRLATEHEEALKQRAEEAAS